MPLWLEGEGVYVVFANARKGKKVLRLKGSQIRKRSVKKTVKTLDLSTESRRSRTWFSPTSFLAFEVNGIVIVTATATAYP